MVGIRFTETMRGFFSTSVRDGRYEDGEMAGQAENNAFAFTLTITADDVNVLVNDPQHPAGMAGTATAATISPDPMTVSNGVFNLFVDDPDSVDTKLMKYAMTLTTTAGRVLYFSGFKVVHKDTALQAWPETSTLYTTIRDGANNTAPILGQGILHILPADFQKQMQTLEEPGAANPAEQLQAAATFGQYFAQVTWRAYGGPFAGPTVFDKDAPPHC